MKGLVEQVVSGGSCEVRLLRARGSVEHVCLEHGGLGAQEVGAVPAGHAQEDR